MVFSINVSADVGRPSQRGGFIEQPVNSGLFELLPTLSLLALELQLMLTRVLLQLGPCAARATQMRAYNSRDK